MLTLRLNERVPDYPIIQISKLLAVSRMRPTMSVYEIDAEDAGLNDNDNDNEADYRQTTVQYEQVIVAPFDPSM